MLCPVSHEQAAMPSTVPSTEGPVPSPGSLSFPCLGGMPGGGRGAFTGQAHLRLCERGHAGQRRAVFGKEVLFFILSFFFYFILKAGFRSNSIWYFEGNMCWVFFLCVCPSLYCCFRKTILLLISSWCNNSVVCVQERKVIARTEIERSRITYASVYLLELMTV